LATAASMIPLVREIMSSLVHAVFLFGPRGASEIG
jgi:hypothetical protein